MKTRVQETIDGLRQAQTGDVPETLPGEESPLDDSEALVVFDGLGGQPSLPAPDGSEGAGAVFRVHLAKSRTLQDAGQLVQRRYTDRGYQTPAPAVDADPQLTTFVAYNQGQVVGTVGIRLDMAGGEPLGADSLYHDELDRLRASGAKICEYTRLAVDRNASSRSVLAALFHTAYLFAHRVRGYDCAVIEVNPRHVLYYKRALGFEVIGPERINRRVNAPAVLLCISFQDIARGLAAFGGRMDLARQTHTLFPYGFPPEEEAGVLGRLQGLRAAALA